MLSTVALVDAKMDTTSNELLKLLYESVCFYNSGAVAKNDEPNYLERLLVGLGTWLTSHPPKNTATNKARWTAMEKLADQVGEEMRKLGLRTLAGPNDWKLIGEPKGGTAPSHAVHRSYWLEMLSPDHGVGFQLSPKFAEWKINGVAGESFWTYVRMNPPYAAKHVSYYDASAAEAYRVEFDSDGKLKMVHDGSLYDTTALETCASGKGWAIFVLSPEGKLYSHKHVEGEFHHSSFLSGSAVVAAGEMLVVQGEVRIINAKSGHYLPLPENMMNLVKQLPLLPKDAIILPDFSAKPPPAHRIQEYRFNPKAPSSVKRAVVEAKLTPTANNASARKWIDTIAAV